MYERAKYLAVRLPMRSRSTRSGRTARREEDLLEQHFRTAVAGEEFYVRLKEVAPDQLAEIYFCA